MPLPPNRVLYSPIIDRPPIKWPNDARVAFWIAPNIEYYEYLAEPNAARNPSPPIPFPNVPEYSYADYGNRIAFWRMLEVLDKYEFRCCAPVNLGALERFPEVCEAMVQRDWDFMDHGIYNSRFLNLLTEDEEREYFRHIKATLKRLTGKDMKGMLGPAASATVRTPDIMAEAGLIYHCVWMHDDQPVPIKVKAGKLVSVPYSLELNDLAVYRFVFQTDLVDRCKAQFDRLYQEGAESGLVMCVVLHPLHIGQPHRVKYLDEILSYVLSHEGVWCTTADEIAEYYIANYYDEAVAHAERLADAEKLN